MLSKIKKITQNRYFQILVILCVIGCIVLGTIALKSGITMDDLKNYFHRLLDFLQSHPVWLFAALVILPSLPVPASPLLILAGVVYSPMFGTPVACLLALSAMALSMSWSYLVAAYPARHLVEKLLERLEIKIPALTTGKHIQLIAILRITPGFPFFIQNLILGFLRVPFRLYLPLSTALCTIFIVGFVVSGGAVFEGNFVLILFGIVLIILAVALTGFLRKKFAAKSSALS